MSLSKIEIKGRAIIQRRRKSDKKLLSEIKVDNLVVNTGLERIAKMICGADTTDFSYIAIGEDDTDTSSGDIELNAEVMREEAEDGGVYEDNFKAVFEKTFTAPVGESYLIKEAAVFDTSTETGQTMLDRFTFIGQEVDDLTELYIKITVTVSTF